MRITSKAYRAGYEAGRASTWRSIGEAEAATRVAESTLTLLLEAEPGLEKYRVGCPEDTNGHLWCLRTWNLDGLRSALEFRRNQANAEALLGSPTVGPKSTGAEGKK